jgi:hypothetical protein
MYLTYLYTIYMSGWCFGTCFPIGNVIIPTVDSFDPPRPTLQNGQPQWLQHWPTSGGTSGECQAFFGAFSGHRLIKTTPLYFLKKGCFFRQISEKNLVWESEGAECSASVNLAFLSGMSTA